MINSKYLPALLGLSMIVSAQKIETHSSPAALLIVIAGKKLYKYDRNLFGFTCLAAAGFSLPNIYSMRAFSINPDLFKQKNSEWYKFEEKHCDLISRCKLIGYSIASISSVLAIMALVNKLRSA